MNEHIVSHTFSPIEIDFIFLCIYSHPHQTAQGMNSGSQSMEQITANLAVNVNRERALGEVVQPTETPCV